MGNEDHILISLTPRHAANIFSGSKKVELRRRTMHIAPGTTAWIYVKLPVGAIIGNIQVKSVHALSPTTLWRRFSKVSGLSKNEFFDYFSGITKGTALELESPHTLQTPLSLKHLRKTVENFQPPQFFTRLTDKNPVLKAITAEMSQGK